MNFLGTDLKANSSNKAPEITLRCQNNLFFLLVVPKKKLLTRPVNTKQTSELQFII